MQKRFVHTYLLFKIKKDTRVDHFSVYCCHIGVFVFLICEKIIVYTGSNYTVYNAFVFGQVFVFFLLKQLLNILITMTQNYHGFQSKL